MLEISLPSGTPAAVYDGNSNLTPQAEEVILEDNSPAVTSTAFSKKVLPSNSTTLTENDLKTQASSVEENNVLGSQVISSIQDAKSSFPVLPLFSGLVGIIIVSFYLIKYFNFSPKNDSSLVSDGKNISTKSIADKIRIIEED